MSTMLTEDFRFYSVQEAAAAIPLTEGRLRQMLNSGDLKGRRVNGETGQWVIPADEVERLRDNPNTRGRPRGGQKAS
jgi:predicted phage tail protein